MPYKDPAVRKAYLEATRAQRLAQRRTYREIHREDLLAQSRKYEATNRPQRNAKSRKYNADHPEKRKAYMAVYSIEHGNDIRETRRQWRQALPEEKKARKRTTDREYQKANAEKISIAHHQWYMTHKEKHAEYMRSYVASHKEEHNERGRRRRALKANAPINDLTPAQWVMIKNHYKHSCVYCGKKSQRLTQDHVIPLSKGGSHTLSNVAPACKSCNSKKRDRAPLVPVQPLLL